MASPSPPSFITRVRQKSATMHPAERRLADFVLNFPGELASYTATELARLANVSNATVSRFVQKLGYAGYEEARRHVRAERRTGAALFLAASSNTDPDQQLQAHLEQGRANLTRTFQTVSMTEIDALAQAMISARRVWVLGFRTSQSFATYLHWQTLQVIDQICVIPGPGHTMGEHIASMDSCDCVIAFGLRRRIGKLDRILEQITASGARLAYITDEGVPRAKGPAWHFQCQTPATGPLFDHVAVLSLCHLLATRVIALAGPHGRRRLSAIETTHEALDEI